LGRRIAIAALILLVLMMAAPLIRVCQAELLELAYDDGEMDWAESLAGPSFGPGHGVRFTPPGTPWIIDSVRIYGRRQGESKFRIVIFDETQSVVYKSPLYDYEEYFDIIYGWAEVDIPEVSVTGDFYVVVFTNSSAGLSPRVIKIGLDKDAPIDNRSYIVSHDYRFSAYKLGDWMIRVVGEIFIPFNFSLSVAPKSLRVVQGEEATYEVDVDLVSGTPTTVELSVEGLPAGSYSLTPNSGVPPFSSTLTVDTNSVSPTSYDITIRAAGGEFAYEETVKLEVYTAEFDFSVEVSPPSRYALKNEAVYHISVKLIEGSTREVNLNVSGLPENTSYLLDPPSGLPDFESKLVVFVGDAVPPGTYNFTVSASGDNRTREASAKMVVLKAATPPASQGTCIIATATYGSELAPEVQFLREFRDETVLRTFAGSCFMRVFNAWYYSFSPAVAKMIAANGWLRAVMRIILYPLIGILHLSAMTYGAVGFNPEVGVVAAGLVASTLLGIVYVTPAATAALWTLRRLFNWTPKQTRELRLAAVGVCLTCLISMLASYAFMSAIFMMFASASLVLTFFTVPALTLAGKFVEYL